MNVTIKKIAELSNVSVGTVDRVLNKRGKVKPEVEKRVLAIAKALNYRPNSAAKSLALRSKNVKVGIVSHVKSNYRNYAVNEAFSGIKAAENDYLDFGITLSYQFGNDFDVEDQLRIIDTLLEEGIVALAITPINDSRICTKLDAVVKHGIPVFCFINDVITEQKHFFIGIDNYRVGCIAAGLFNLLRKELLNIAIVFPSLSLLGNIERLKGFEDTINTRYSESIHNTSVCVATNDDITSYLKVKSMLSKLDDINAIFYASGAVEGGMRAIEEAGLLGKALIISIDPSEIVKRNLENGNIKAVINQNTYEAGYKTIKLMYDYIMFGSLPNNQFININSDILIREHY